uniref:3-oxoacid CoA-transferase n=1 Tax=Rhabditophanes sp. KR3021 TaxID=114890 RepID=A0AC35U2A0_9BILA
MLSRASCLKQTSLLTAFRSLSTSQRLDATFFENADEAVADIPDGAKLLVGGFGICGLPENLITALSKKGTKNLTCVSNNAGTDNHGLGVLLQKRQIKKMISSYVGENALFANLYLSGEIELEFTPQGTLAEKIRAGGAGIPAFYTPTAVGTLLQEGGAPIKYSKTEKGKIEIFSQPKETKMFNGVEYVLEEAITGDYSLIKAQVADKNGNVCFNKTAGNFNAPMAKAGKITIVEVEEIVENGQLDPNHIHIPSIYNQRIVLGKNYIKPIEKPMFKTDSAAKELPKNDCRNIIASRAALEFEDGMYINLGIGIPTLTPNYVPKGYTVHLQSENGVIGVGPYPEKGQECPDLINAGKECVTLLAGASIVSSDEAFAMIRGGHIMVTMLGGLEVNQYGDFANWMIPNKMVKGVGGAMDLVSAPGARVIVTMEHTAKGKPKILEKCTLPLTGKNVASRIITEMAVFDVCKKEGLTLIEVREDLTVEDIKKNTGAPFKAVYDIPDNATIMFGGFGVCGVPEKLIEAIKDKRIGNLTCISNSAGTPDYGLGLLIEFTPQGTLAEKIRSGGAGIPAFFTPSGYGTVVECGSSVIKFNNKLKGHIDIVSKKKEVRQFNGINYVMEHALKADFAIIKGWKADRYGNVIFKHTAMNFNKPMARASNCTIVEVEEIVDELDPNNIHSPHIFNDRIVLGKNYLKPIEKPMFTTKKKQNIKVTHPGPREIIAARAALEFEDGVYCNLGLGLPTLVTNYIPKDVTVNLHSENGVLNFGPYPEKGKECPDLVNASKEPITLLKGASIFSSDESFAMIRSSKIQIALLGALQVSEFGDLSNWIVPGKKITGMGGAMCLVSSPGVRVVVLMEHLTKNHKNKIVKKCSLPLTGKNVVSRIITEMGVFDVDKETGLTLIEIHNDIELNHLKRITGCPFKVAEDLKIMGQSELN